MKIERYNYGNTKIAFLHKNTFSFFFGEDENIIPVAKSCNLDIHQFNMTYPEFLIHDADFNEHKRFTSQSYVHEIYEKIYNYVKDNEIKIVIIFWAGHFWSEEFVERLKKISYVAGYFGDDTDEADVTSKPYVKYYDYAFTGSYLFTENITVPQKYIEWGAPKAKFIPLGAKKTSYPERISNLTDRDIDITYVGTNKLTKFFFIARLKRYFGQRMRIYGKGWNGNNSILRTTLLEILKFWYRIPKIDAPSQKNILKIYGRTKIGINMHQSWGPSNVRSYELPLNGIMQITDNEKGYRKIYKIGKEIVTYKNHDHREAIKRIEYYLKHPKERMTIAMAGYRRAAKEYKLEDTFKQLIDEIRRQKRYKNLLKSL